MKSRWPVALAVGATLIGRPSPAIAAFRSPASRAPAAPQAAPARVVAFACKIVGGRTRILVPRGAEAKRVDDDLECWANLDGLPRRATWLALGAELRITSPGSGGRARTVATGDFELSDDRPGRAWVTGLIAPHSTWSAGIDWRDPRRPRLRLSLHVFLKDTSRRRNCWQRWLVARFELRNR